MHDYVTERIVLRVTDPLLGESAGDLCDEWIRNTDFCDCFSIWITNNRYAGDLRCRGTDVTSM